MTKINEKSVFIIRTESVMYPTFVAIIVNGRVTPFNALTFILAVHDLVHSKITNVSKLVDI
jgi:hypothetical protein